MPDVVHEVEVPQSVDALFDAELTAETERATTPALILRSSPKEAAPARHLVPQSGGVRRQLLHGRHEAAFLRAALVAGQRQRQDERSKVYCDVDLPKQYRGTNTIIESVAHDAEHREMRSVHALNVN